jgi:hypothetical protein
MHSAWFNVTEILQGRWQHGEKVGYCYPRGLEKTLCKWDIYGYAALHTVSFVHGCFAGKCIVTRSTEQRYFKVDGSMEKKVGYCNPSVFEKTLCKWDIYVPLVTKGLK